MFLKLPAPIRRISRCRAIGLLVASAIPLFAAPKSARADDKIQFNRDIRPILSENCFFCHGPDKGKRKADMRLDLRDDALEHAAIVPGKPNESDMVARIFSDDPEKHMPPPESNKKLTDAQKKLLREWIAAGAEYQPHWAYIKPVKPTTPEGQHAVDALVEARLQREGLKLSAEAERRTLIRRLSFDLTGLPPKPEEVDAFIADKAPDAYEKLVDRLLASPHYGERMAVYWLDVVRYADTIGYHSDNPRNVWPYRDWVIKALNDNKPFDQFTIEQLAGDLLPDSTKEQKVASCFNRLLLSTEEGGAQAKDYEARMLTDRVRAMGTVWLGQTIGCCNCHDHKFDPLTQRDFFAMGAFFADIQESVLGRREDGMPIPDAAQDAELKKLDAETAAVQKQLDDKAGELTKAQEEWEKSIAAALESKATWTPLEPDTATSDHDVTLKIEPDHSIRAERDPADGVATYLVTFKTPVKGITGLRLEALADKALAGGGPGRSSNGNIVLTELQVLDAGGKLLPLSAAAADYEQPGFPASASIDGKLDQPHGWGVYGSTGVDHHLDVAFKEPLSAADKPADQPLALSVKLAQLWGQNHTLAKFRVSATTTPQPVQAVGKKELPPGEIVAIIKLPAGKRDAGQQAKLKEHYKSIAPELAPLRLQLSELKKKRTDLDAKIAKCLVSISGQPRVVHMLSRGNFLQEVGEPIQPDTPKALPPLGVSGRRPTRLDLARWVVSPDNPLTARVFVNRVWKQLFGMGLSRNLDDLGSQGEAPINPELLDWLACDFVDHGWDIKRLIRTIVTSRAYRQTSVAPEAMLARDPANRLCARQSRFRLDAEFVRDTALEISGLLVDKQGGPSAKPYQPDGYWENLNFPQRTYDADKGEGQYRRGLYTWWQRTFLHPSLLAFDAPSREECVAERNRSNIPQQALVLLNDPTYVEAARAFAARIMKDGGGDTKARLSWAWRHALQREPRDDERAVATAVLEKELARYAKAPAEAEKLLHVGLAPAPTDRPHAELAAWTSVARVILNLHETITRE